jgi:hypothetical protein
MFSECGHHFKEVEMRKHVLLLTTTAAINGGKGSFQFSCRKYLADKTD